MLRIGILGAAGIAPKAIIAPAARRDDARITAVASRSDASEYARRHGIPIVYDTYDALVSSSDVDLVYVALPPSEHARWSIAALQHGKDVLCEKPFAMNEREALDVQRVAALSGRRVIEAFHDHYHPLQAWIRDTVTSGRLGEIRAVDAEFRATNPFDPLSIRHDPRLGGGALMDLGCYPVHWVRSLFGEPAAVRATAALGPLGADAAIDATLVYDGFDAAIRASMTAEGTFRCALRIDGSAAQLHVDNLVFPSMGHSIRIVAGGLERTLTVGGDETYDHQLAAVVAALSSGEPLATEGADTVGNMRVIEEIYAQAGVARDWIGDSSS